MTEFFDGSRRAKTVYLAERQAQILISDKNKTVLSLLPPTDIRKTSIGIILDLIKTEKENFENREENISKVKNVMFNLCGLSDQFVDHLKY